MAFHFLKAHFPSVKIMSNYLKNETKYFIFMELRANFDEAESKYKMENRILMSELQDAREKLFCWFDHQLSFPTLPFGMRRDARIIFC